MLTERLKWTLVLGPAVVAGIAGSAVALTARGADDAFLYRQENPLRIQVEDVEELVKSAPEPVEGSHPPGISARCKAQGSGELRNPWRCRVRYRSGNVETFAITIRTDGSYVGAHRGNPDVVEGCCLHLPGIR